MRLCLNAAGAETCCFDPYDLIGLGASDQPEFLTAAPNITRGAYRLVALYWAAQTMCQGVGRSSEALDAGIAQQLPDLQRLLQDSNGRQSRGRLH